MGGSFCILWLIICLVACFYENEHLSLGAASFIEVISILDKSSAAACLLKVHTILKSAQEPGLYSFRFVVVEDAPNLGNAAIHRASGDAADEGEVASATRVFTVQSWRDTFSGCFPGVRAQSKRWERPAALAGLSSVEKCRDSNATAEYQAGAGTSSPTGVLSGEVFEVDAIYARFFLPQLFPSVSRFIYLDNDVLVTTDLRALFVTHLTVPADPADIPPASSGPPMASASSAHSAAVLKRVAGNQRVISVGASHIQQYQRKYPHMRQRRQLHTVGVASAQPLNNSSIDWAMLAQSNEQHRMLQMLQQTGTPRASSGDRRRSTETRRGGDSSRRLASRQTAAVVGFVFEQHPFYRGYLRDHFNHSQPLVQQALARRPADAFLNGGVFVVDAALWRELHLTERSLAIIAANNNCDSGGGGSGGGGGGDKPDEHRRADSPRRYCLYSASVGDQGAFLLLLQDRIAYLPARYNMRRLPKKTVQMLEDGRTTGIVHLAGTSQGRVSFLCEHPVQHPLLLSAVVPLHLAAVNSFLHACPRSPYSPSLRRLCMEQALPAVQAEMRREGISPHYNPGRGNFRWPIPNPYPGRGN